jgi:type I restriction enzyme S subunit
MNCQLDGQVVFRDLQFVDLDSKTLAAFRVNDGDLLFNRTNSFELVGRTAIFRSEREAVFASYLIRLTLDQNALHPEFVNYFFNQPSVQSALKKLASRGVSQANINATKLKEVLIPLASLDEQRQIAAILEGIDRKITVHERKRGTLQELFKTLLQELMTGRLRVLDLDIDASEVTVH